MGIMVPMTLDSLLSHWRTDPLTAPNLSTWQTTPPRLAKMHPFPSDMPAALVAAFASHGITALYSHQAEAWEAVRRGENIVLATGTASGKTLGYNLPVLSTWLENPDTRALYLFPTKALAQDQFANLTSFQSTIKTLKSAIYDGDTPSSHRPLIRKNANIIFSNPDMLHTGILPHHTTWADFFRRLRFVVIDEMHTYRGVFGSHFANVIRRLKRVAAFYGAGPQFILTSATIGNPQELAERLIEAPVTLLERDGSSRGERHFLIYNPPLVDDALGLRKSSMLESVRLSQELSAQGIQQVVFARSRRSVEILLKYLQEGSPPISPISTGNKGGPGGGAGRRFGATVVVISPPSVASSKKVFGMARSGLLLPPMPSSWVLISAAWAPRCWWATRERSPAPGSRPAAPAVATTQLWQSWWLPPARLTSSWLIIPIISLAALPNRP